MGTTLREMSSISEEEFPVVKNSRRHKWAVSSGGCVPAQHLDLPIDYETVKEVGAIMGSGGLIVMDDSTSMVDIALFYGILPG